MQDLGEKEVYGSKWRLLGYPIFGGWLPFIGFRNLPISKEDVEQFLGCEVESATYNPFCLEWLCRGISMGKLRVKPKVK